MRVKNTLIVRPPAVIPLLKGYANKKQEHFGVICLDAGQRAISRDLLFIGGSNFCEIDKKVLFWKIVKRQAVGVILFHNHPGGRTEPSVDDMETTQNIARGLGLLGVQLFDHVIVGKNGYFSFLEHDILPKDSD